MCAVALGNTMTSATQVSRKNFSCEADDKQVRWWIFTFPYESFDPCWIDDNISYYRGQCEISVTGYWHYHVVVNFKRSVRFSFVKAMCPSDYNIQPIRDRDAAIQYVWKDGTSLPFSRFEDGVRPVRRSSRRDWQEAFDHAKEGNFDLIDPSVVIQHYGNLKRIRADYCTPPERTNIKVFIYWGISRSGKSFRAKEEAKTMGSYFSKIPSTKWWCGYQDHPCVIFNEFTGKISIEHILQWLDWTPCVVETKGGSTPLFATSFWFTSNKPPHQWWPECHPAQWDAFQQRITNSVEFTERYTE